MVTVDSNRNITFKIGDIEFKMIYIKGNTFRMGADHYEIMADTNEFPQHEVTLDDYYIAETVVTQSLWETIMGFNRSEPTHPDAPVDLVSWEEAQLFCEKLKEMTETPFRLPTEAEWEYAAKGGILHGGYCFSGSDHIEEITKVMEKGNPLEAVPVKQYKPNGFGLYNMTGCVWQWVQDKYDLYHDEPQVNPQVLESDDPYRVTRGGCRANTVDYNTCLLFCRTTSRSNYDETSGVPGLGFRLAIDGPIKEKQSIDNTPPIIPTTDNQTIPPTTKQIQPNEQKSDRQETSNSQKSVNRFSLIILIIITFMALFSLAMHLIN